MSYTGALDWQSHFAQCTAEDMLDTAEASTDFFADPCLNFPDLGLDVDFDAHLYRDTLMPASSFLVDAPPGISPPFSSDSGPHTFDDFTESTLDCPVIDNHFNRIPTGPFPTSHPPSAATSCYAQQRPSCIITATESLRSLHVQQNACQSRQSNVSHNNHDHGPEQPRMSGSVLKCNKDAGMSVCRMLQCTCSLRPQNQLMIAIICSKLIAWYRAMIQTCFKNQQGLNETQEDTSLEKVIHQPVTIGDHSVDDQGLGLTIQAQVTLRELHHMQRLVETLSTRMQGTATPAPISGSIPKAGTRPQFSKIPEAAHGQLLAHLMRQVHAAKADLLAVSQVL
ncbi:unnamed protein product [Penicillium olsonii]|uniref:Aflatoxin regulatory protein domain-containing protein n=1 Tax=Penicillium olsonii TaxID=99116 RepID=A0A9W4MMU2_PENOL|nr:unnamed protein product [Penicillium olsonii]CAG8185817.1 unnamed protein product [Penicillium olsonii]